ncbi:G-type lectin S-receptor-like serine/threonine-protein kinase At4g27290 [Curcuma longa]|uniref:G-type lectin S-receptor-like serine/threonine-protein kinase At4g27290 n=1 Tax=Curcuma longa TaxID=136217 RepID=UPI003D9F544A
MEGRTASSSSFSLVCLLFLFVSTFFSISRGADTLSIDRPLLDDDTTTLISPNGNFRLGFFSPNGSNSRYVGIWYNNIPLQTVVWVANRRRPIADRSGSLSLTSDGALVISDGSSNSTAVWSSGSPAPALENPVAQLLDDGNFVVREAGDNGAEEESFAWRSFDFPTDTQIPGMMMGRRRLRNGVDHNINLTAWTSDGDPAPSQYTYGLEVEGNPQLLTWSGTQPYWRAGPWNGRWFSGVPEVTDMSDGLVFFDVQPNRITFLYNPQSTAVLRWVIHHSGQLQLIVWLESEQDWNIIWYVPKDLCDSISSCGPNGLCRPSSSPLCACLPGFRPRNPTNWGLLDGSDGCARTTARDCRNNTDGFFTQRGAKLPDTSRSTVVPTLTLEQCRALCLSNCSCTAFAASNVSVGRSVSGCIIWTTDLTDITVYQGGLGQDLYVRLAAADLVSESSSPGRSRRRNLAVAMGVVLPVVAISLACAAYFVWRKKRGPQIHQKAEGEDLELPLLDLSTIRDATNGFSIANKLGEGGFGPVYKGKLGEEQEIAIKRLSTTSTQGANEFKNEVTLIAKLQHRNLVRLLGCCIQGAERMLVYEYMPNGSLDAFLFDEVRDKLLDWRTRYNIIIGIARGLMYLHHDSRLRIIHRDLKAGNVLLDQDMNPKISDFGMARLFRGDQSEANTQRVVGTYGYMSPEYIMDGIFSIKSDVYSFGVLVLEIITGKTNRRVFQHQTNLLEYAWNMWKEGEWWNLVDKNIDQVFSKVEVMKCIKIGLLCVQEWPKDRPTMPLVLTMLDNTEDINLLPEPKQPWCASKAISSEDSATTHLDSGSIGKELVTELQGR